jgi:RimJ/RimL family protein N-acetyltransferase
MVIGNKVHLVPFQREHLENPAYFHWLNDVDVIRYIGRPELFSGISFPEMEKYVENLWENSRCWFFAVVHTDQDTFIGTAKVSFSSKGEVGEDIGDVGIMIGEKRFWGLGLGSDVLRCLSRHAFNELGARKLSAGAMSPNTAVIKSFLRIGYIEEGRVRHKFFNEGQYCDHVLLGCFEDELF